MGRRACSADPSLEDRVTDIDRAIAAYRRELTGEAELASADLDEIEDHLRALVDELRGTGVPAADAIAEAARRLGEPRAVAREHARVRSVFGARLSRARAYSAAALVIPMVVWFGWRGIAQAGLWSRSGLELASGIVLVIGLVARLAWARAVLLGYAAAVIVPSLLWAVWFPSANLDGWLVCYLGLFGFVAPWRRGELTAAGAGLALQVATYCTAALALAFQYTGPDGWVPVAPAAELAVGAAMLATVGSLLRAKWGALAAAASAIAMTVAVVQLWSLTVRMPHPTVYRIELLGMMVAAAIAAATNAAITWRGARGALGTLRGLA